jgi:hypothetical protein
VTDTDTMQIVDLIDEIATKLDNAWPAHRQECHVADAIGKPAFWTKTGAERATIMLLAQLATRDSMARAMDAYWLSSTAAALEALDQLIPLNHEAVMQLRLAYTGFGQYPRLAELHDRRNV